MKAPDLRTCHYRAELPRAGSSGSIALWPLQMKHFYTRQTVPCLAKQSNLTLILSPTRSVEPVTEKRGSTLLSCMGERVTVPYPSRTLSLSYLFSLLSSLFSLLASYTQRPFSLEANLSCFCSGACLAVPPPHFLFLHLSLVLRACHAPGAVTRLRGKRGGGPQGSLTDSRRPAGIACGATATTEPPSTGI